jgi:hypothetical protein
LPCKLVWPELKKLVLIDGRTRNPASVDQSGASSNLYVQKRMI